MMEKRKIKKVFALTAAAVLAVSAAGCSNGGGAPSDVGVSGDVTDSSTQGTQAADVAPGKKGTLEFWTVFTGADGSSMQAMVDEYNATNPDYTVNHRAMEANDLYLKLPLAIQSGQDVPDVAISHIERLPLFVENGFLTDYTDLLAGSKIKKDNYLKTAWDMSDIDGGHYGIPLDVHSFVTYVNMDLYNKYGNGALDDGILTWDDIYASGEAAKADGIIDVGIGWYRANWLSSYAQLGGTLSTDGTDPSFANDIGEQVLNKWKKFYDAGYTSKEGDDPWAMFTGGKMLYCPEGIWMRNQAEDAKLNYKMVEYPAWDVNHRGGWTSSHQFILPKKANRTPEETKAVLDFINFLGEHSLEWARAGQRPAHVSINDSPEFKSMPQSFITDDYLLMYDYKYYGYATESLDKIFPEVFFERMAPMDGLKQAQQETKDLISTQG